MTGKHTSPWLDAPAAPARPPLAPDQRCEVAVLGGGITGATLAALLAEAGVDVVLLDMNRFGHGVTGLTTAKVSSQHGLIYDRLSSTQGDEHARTYGEANEAALAWIAQRIAAHDIECDFRRRPAYTYVTSASKRSDVEREAETATRLGLPAHFVEALPLPYPVEAAVRFDDQAEFDSYRYTAALAAQAGVAGARLAEHTRAVQVHDGAPCRVETDHGALLAEQVAICTHFPFADRSLSFARAFPMRSYCVAGFPQNPPPDGMFISAEGATRSIRSTPSAGREMLIVGGEGHKVGTDSRTGARYERLTAFAREHFGVEEIEYRWSSQDPHTADHIPFVGPVTPVTKRVWMATGYGKWGMTNGTVAAMILAERLQGHDHPWTSTFESNRLRLRASVAELAKENAQVGFHFLADRVRLSGRRALEDLAKGEGGLVKHAGETVGGYRDEEGGLHAVSPTCTHLFCRLNWNEAERSWDCPCHGSRFDVDGTVLEGPAVRDLERKLT